MDFIEEVLSNMVFFKNTPWEFTEIKISTQALALLCEIDGERTLSAISRRLGQTVEELSDGVNELGRLNLIHHEPQVAAKHYEVIPPDSHVLPHSFSSLLRKKREKHNGEKKVFRGVSY